MEKYFDINESGFSIRCKLYYNKDLHNLPHIVVATYGFGGNKDNKAIEKFAERLTTKYHGYGVVCFDWPCHGKDARNKLILDECCTYLDLVTRYVRDTMHAEDVYNYSSSFGAYITLRYLAEQQYRAAANADDHRADGCNAADPAGTTSRSAADTAQGDDGSGAGCIEQGQAAGAPNLQALLTNRSFLIITFIMFMYVGFENTVNGWFVTYLKDTGVMTSALATAMVSVTWIMMMAGRIGTAQFLQHVNKLRIILVSALIDFVAIVLLVNTHTATMAAIIIAVLGLGMSAIYPTTVAAAGPIIEGSTMGLSLLTGISAIGGILVPQIIGILADYVGIAGAMVTVVLTVGIMLALSILAVHRDRRGLMG